MPANKQTDIRARALKALEMMTPEHIVTAGLSADFSAEVLRFVRLHDVRNWAWRAGSNIFRAYNYVLFAIL